MTLSTNIQITSGDLLDLNAVVQVMEDSFDPAYGEAWTAAQCAGLLPLPGVWLTLAKEGEDIVAFSLSRTVVREAELLLIAVKRSRQGNGIGQLLVQRFIEDASARGATELHLEVRDGNPAIKLYSSFQFSEVGRRKQYYTGRDGQLHDAITLKKTVC